MSSAHDLAEIARSASEASKIELLDVDLSRYQNPPADTWYPLEYAFYLLGDVRDKVVLDFGCGSGEEIIPLRQRGAYVIGIDISPDLIAVARKRLQKYGLDADLRVGSAYDTQLADQSVDVVFCMSLLHHLDLDHAKKEICRILKPEGLFIFKEPIRFSWMMKQLRQLLPALEDVSEFEYPLNAAQIRTVVEGFEVIGDRSFRTPVAAVLARIIKSRAANRKIRAWDDWMLRHLPPLAHFATIRVMALRPGVASVRR